MDEFEFIWFPLYHHPFSSFWRERDDFARCVFLRFAKPALSPSSDEETMSVAKPGGGELEAPLEFERQTNGRPTAAFSQFSLNLLLLEQEEESGYLR